jgi:hypothetical protein
MSALTTIYLGRRIFIEPFEWGYLAHVELGSDKRLVGAHPTAMQALERAFDIVDSDSSAATSSPLAGQPHIYDRSGVK